MKSIITILSLLFSLSGMFAQQYWTDVVSGTTLDLNSISFGSETVGYIGGNDSLLLKTTDGGDTWNPIQFSGIDFSSNQGLTDITHIEFVSETEGFLAINDADTLTYYAGEIYKTVDGGASWVLEETWMCSPLRTFHFDANTGFAVGSSCFGGKTISRKENGTWSSNTTYLSWNIEYIRAIDFYDANIGMVGGDSAQIHRTFDGGMTWDTIDLNIQNFAQNGGVILDIQYIDEETIVLTNNLPNTGFCISFDGGLTWDHHSAVSFSSPNMKSVAYSSKDSIITVGSTIDSWPLGKGDVIWYQKTSTGGYFNEQFSSFPLNEVTMANDSIAFAVGKDGTIISNKSTLTSVINLQPQTPQINIYPNPASDQIKIESENMNRIEIVDLLGRVVNTIVTEGETQKSIDISQLESGVYLLKVHFKNGKTISKEVVCH